MKKRIAFCLLVVLILNLCACSAGDGYNEDTEKLNSSRGEITDDNIDPNGFSSVEALLDVVLSPYLGKTVSKNQIYKMYPKVAWDEGYMDSTLDEAVEHFAEVRAYNQTKYTEEFGSNYVIDYSVVSVVDGGAEGWSEGAFTEEEMQEWMRIYGVHPRDCYVYSVNVEFTVRYSGGEETFRNALVVRQIGDKWYA